MGSTPYLAAWLLAALVAVGILSWRLAHYTQHHDDRGLQAQHLAQALQRYSDWLRAQRLAAAFDGESPEAAAAMDEACTIHWLNSHDKRRFIALWRQHHFALHLSMNPRTPNRRTP
ncbi:MAG TPA: hypothetical protein VF522_14300 [Ramlibacter sp.]|uniref:hypothetical protein n=1 Tax=Ramlibacter sp. TaxID=1917967 RepID=UPI002ED1311B